MLRLLPLLALIVAPAVVVLPDVKSAPPPEIAPVVGTEFIKAPIPHDVKEAEFGTNGLLTRADLKRVKFDTQPFGDTKPTAPREFDLAVHMPRTKFRAGDPIPAYCVLRNNSKKPLLDDSALDVDRESAPHTSCYNGCGFFIRSAGGELVRDEIRYVLACFGGPILIMPAEGFYCHMCDASRTTGKPLPPGKYEAYWMFRGCRSAPVAFTVVKTDERPAPRVKNPNLRVYHLVSENGNRPTWNRGAWSIRDDYRPSEVNAFRMSLDLNCGLGGDVFVPDFRQIPTADGLVAVSAEWKPYRSGDHLSVTLRAVNPEKPFKVADLPHLYIQIEGDNLGLTGRNRDDSFPTEPRFQFDNRPSGSSLTFEARLPHDWRDRCGVSGTVRIAVIVVSKWTDVPWEQWGSERKLKRLGQARVWATGPEVPANDVPAPVWNGVLRTEFTELHFPKSSK